MFVGYHLRESLQAACLGLLTAGLTVFGCGGGGAFVDGGNPDGERDGGGDGRATYVKPEGYASVTFFVDDTANRTYGSGEIEWKGSMVYDPATNIIVFDPTWAKELGPYPPLHDDGPIADGGHEMPGATASDHIFSLEVYVKADAAFDTKFQYGAINQDKDWIWEGPNGEFVVPAGSTDRIQAEGYYLHAFGTYDLLVLLDIGKLNKAFLPFDPLQGRIYIKGSMNSWAERQLLDNGQKQDAAAGDGIYTYHHAEQLGPHDGMLSAGQHVQFVFMINDMEYKLVDALSDGVSARTNCEAPEAWIEAPIFMEPESRGRIKNTTVAICQGGGNVAVTSVVPPSGDPAGGMAVAVYGSGFQDGARVAFGGELAAAVQFVDQGQINCTTPPHIPGSVAVRVTNPGGDFGELPDGFAYLQGDQPEILFLEPRMGPVAGGTLVTITGRRFQSGAQATFGGAQAKELTVVGAQQITCRTPPGSAGRVTVTVTNPGGLSGSFPEGFEYLEGQGPLVYKVEPSVGSTRGGDSVTISGSGFDAGAAVFFDQQAALDLVVNPLVAIGCKTPPHPEGLVNVRVVNPDNQEGVLGGGFTYQRPQVDWARLQAPLSMVLNASESSPPVYGQVYERGVTEEAGCGFGILAQLGYGPQGAVPADDPASWTWTAAACNQQCLQCGNNDEYQASFAIPAAGRYSYAYRFSMDDGQSWVYADGNGTQDGYQAAEAGWVTVRGGGADLQVWEVVPEVGSVLGGTEVTVLGNAFQDGAVVSVDREVLSTTWVSASTLAVVTLPHAAGAVELAVTNPDSQVSALPAGFHYVLRGAPVLDGVIGPDWDASFLAGENAAGSDWGANHLDRLYLAFDDQNLYLGLLGWVEASFGNTLVVYLDVDFGLATGVINMNLLTDVSTGIDDAISSVCNVTAAGFGAEFAVATRGMAGVEPSDLAPDAGLRLLVTPASPDNFYWLPAVVRTSSIDHGVEAALPLAALLGGGIPAEGARLAVFARLVNGDGRFLSDDTLPLDNPDPVLRQQVGQVFVFDIR